MSVADQIKLLLTESLKPAHLEVVNDSHKHAGHRETPGSGESHFTVVIVSDKFSGMPMVKRHQLVYKSITALLGSPVHALSIKAYDTLNDYR